MRASVVPENLSAANLVSCMKSFAERKKQRERMNPLHRYAPHVSDFCCDPADLFLWPSLGIITTVHTSLLVIGSVQMRLSNNTRMQKCVHTDRA
jgi:hypothetical protein